MSSMLARRVELSPRRWLLLPIAYQGRELEGNALLAFEAAERGWGVILSSKGLRYGKNLPCGLILQKELCPGKSKRLVSGSRANGHKVGAWCEEGLIYPDVEYYGRLKFEREGYEELDIYFAWGTHQAE